MSVDHMLVAQHLLTRTYPALSDPKILFSVVQHVMAAIDEGIQHALEEARERKQIPPYSDTFNGRLTAFKLSLAREKGMTPMDFMLIGELQELVREHERSPMAFRRKNAFVIADERYGLHAITPEKTKTYIERARSLLSRL